MTYFVYEVSWFAKAASNQKLNVGLYIVLIFDSLFSCQKEAAKSMAVRCPLLDRRTPRWVGQMFCLLSMLRRGCRGVVLIPMMSLPSTKQDDDNDDEFAPDNVTFAPKDITPIDFTPKVGVQGLGYRGLDPGMALQGRGAREHINLFDPQSNARSELFGGPERDGRRRGVAGQVVFLRPAFSRWVWAGLCLQDTTFHLSPTGIWRWSSGGRG